MRRFSSIALTAASHILQEMTVSSYVPNDTFLVGGTSEEDSNQDGLDNDSDIQETAQHPSMLLLTGPNYSGKSVYMKQVSRFSMLGLALNVS